MSIIEERLHDLGASASRAPSLDDVIQRGERIRRQRRGRRVAITAGIAAAALLIVPVFSIAGHRPFSTSAASDFLNAVADKAAAQQAADASKAPYWYSESRIDYAGPAYTRQVWLGHNKPGRLLQPLPGETKVTEDVLGIAAFNAGSTGVSWDQLFALPRDPDALYAWLKLAVGDAGHDVDSEMFVAVGDLLRESPAPPSLRQALFRVAATIPDVGLTPGITDSLGRPATAVSRSKPDGTGSVRYLIDASTGSILEEQSINPDGSTGFQTTYVASGPVTNTTSRVPHN
jgi:hypothetical protein